MTAAAQRYPGLLKQRRAVTSAAGLLAGLLICPWCQTLTNALVASSGLTGIGRLTFFMFCKAPEAVAEADSMGATPLIPRAEGGP